MTKLSCLQKFIKERLVLHIRKLIQIILLFGNHHGRDRMVVGFTTNYAISAYHH
jgi:hypothetical protein